MATPNPPREPTSNALPSAPLASPAAPYTPSPTDTPATTSTAQQQPELAAKENAILHNVALGVTPIALGALFLPPRKFDLRLIILGGVALWGTNQLVHDYTGTSTLSRMGGRLENLVPGTELPEKAQRTQMLIRQERERRAKEKADLARLDAAGRYAAAGYPPAADKVEDGADKKKKGGDDDRMGSLEAIWMGDADPEDWKKERARREREALQEGGGGIWGLIMDHISDVRSSGKQKRAEVIAAREEKSRQEDQEGTEGKKEGK